MIPSPRNWMIALVTATLLAGIGAAHAAGAKGLAAFKGTRSGAFLIAQGPETRLVGIAEIRISSDRSGRNGKIRITGTLGGESFRAQTFKLKRGTASVNVLLPGVDNFANPARGTCKVKGRRVMIAVETGGPGNRKLNMTLQFQPGGGVIGFSGAVDLGAGTELVHLTIVGA